jgi:hypothetical protein
MVPAMDIRPSFRTHGYRKSPQVKIDEVCKVLIEEHGLISPSAERLGMTRAELRKFVGNRSRCAKALKEARGGLADLAERKLYKLIEQGNLGAITFYLSQCAKDRGYGLPPGATLNLGDTNNFIGTVNIMSVPSGTFLPSDPDSKPVGTPFLRIVENEDPSDTQLN